MNKPALSNSQWGSGTILSILKNPVYKGELVSGKRRVTSFKNKKMVKNPPDIWIVVEDAHEAIISSQVWDEVQKIIAKNHVGVRRGGSGKVAMFSGVAKCGDCGAKMTFNRKVYKDYTKEYYRCGRYTNKWRTACQPHTILEGVIYSSVIDDIRGFAKLAFSDESQLVSRITDDNMKHSDKLIKQQENLLNKKERRLAEIDLLMQSLFEDKVSGTVPENIFKRMAKKYDDEYVTLADEIKVLRNEMESQKRSENDIASWIYQIKKCLSIETLTHELVVELIDSIEISDVYEVDGEPQQDIKITYRFENLSSKEKRVS